ncbi:MAG: protein-L-isoaspartate(D-aspartate) O-methyltransferase [Sphingomicrobium sp.]
MAEPNFAAPRADMVDRQIAARGIDDPRLLEAFAAVPRELFVAPELGSRAYDDGPLPIGQGQTISQPYIVALMIAAAEVGPDDRVLEVGAGSGYAAAILGHIAREVVSIECHAVLAEQARQRIAALGLDRVNIVEGDGTLGWPGGAPFDAILVAAAAPRVPRALLDQLRSPGGRLVMPLGGGGWSQQLVKLVRNSSDDFAMTDLGGVRFVPLVGDG